MPKRILIINANPAKKRESFSAALCQAYHDGACGGGHEVRSLNLAELDFDPILHEGMHGEQPPEPAIFAAQDAIKWAEHIVFVAPMWQFNIPALLKGFCERTLTPGFAYALSGKNPLDLALLKGRSARLILTMGMPDAMYRLMYGAHGGKAFKTALGFCGIKPVGLSFFGMIENGDAVRQVYLKRARELGLKAV